MRTALLLLALLQVITGPSRTVSTSGGGGDSDSFAYTGNLSANWTGDVSSFTAATGTLTGPTTGATATAWWAAATFANNQYACTTIGTFTSGGEAIGPAIRMTTLTSGYITYADGSSWQLWLASGTMIGSVSAGVTNGNEYCLYAVGTSLVVEDKTTSTALISVTDSTYSSGYAGLNTYADTTSTTITHWRGGNGTP